MGLFNFGKQKNSFMKNPQTFEEWADYMLMQKDRAKAENAKTFLWKSCLSLPKSQSLPRMAWLANRTVEVAQSDMNREMALETLGQILMKGFGGFSADKSYYDAVITNPDETKAVEQAIWNLYRNGGDMARTAIRRAAGEGGYGGAPSISIDPSFLRPVYAEMTESEGFLKGYLRRTDLSSTNSHYPAFRASSDNYMFPVFDYIVRHKDNMSPEITEVLQSFLKKNFVNTSLLPDYFEKYYLASLGMENDKALLQWFTETFCAQN